MATSTGIHRCSATTAANITYIDFSCVYPLLEPSYWEFEKYYDSTAVLQWTSENPSVPIAAVIIYVAGCFGAQYLMKHRERWHLRYTLAAWNFSLSLFSWVGMFRTAPNLIYNLTTMSLRDNMCREPRVTYGSGSTGLWVQLFIFSKFPELFDTFFIVIHKKPLIFLHWYHHVTVLLYCWHSYATKSPPGLFFVVMNYTVHASMYAYYGLMALRLRPKWLNPMIITSMQISQMIVGVGVTLVAFHYYWNDPEGDCEIKQENNIAAFVMYGSYLFLFLQFFVARYLGAKKSKRSGTKDNGTKENGLSTGDCNDGKATNGDHAPILNGTKKLGLDGTTALPAANGDKKKN